MKKSTWIISISVIIVLILLFGAIYVTQQETVFFKNAIIEEDFSMVPPVLLQNKPNNICTRNVNENGIGTIICEGKEWITKEYTGDFKNGPSTVYVHGTGRLLLTASGSKQPASATFKRDLKGRNIEISDIQWTYGTSRGGGSASVKIYFNDNLAYKDDEDIKVRSSTKNLLFQAIADDENVDLYHILINGKLTGDTVLVPENILNIKVETVASGDFAGSQLFIDNIKSESILSCKVSDDEIIFVDRFCPGVQFTLDREKQTNDIMGLSHKPLKVCPEGSPVLRRVISEQGGIRPEFFDTTFSKLQNFEVVTVPEDELMEVRYVTDYTEGQAGENCDASSCFDGQKCVQVIEEKEDVIELVQLREFIEVGEQQLFFKNSVNVAGKQLTSSKPQYLCANEDDRTSAPLPRENCWQTAVNYGTHQLIFTDRQTKSLNPYMNLKLIIEARYKDGAVQPEYTNNFILSVTSDDVLEIEVLGERDLKDFYVLQDEDKNMEFEVTNNLGTFQQSGVIIRKTTSFLTSEVTETINLQFEKGTKKYSIPVDSSKFGGLTYVVTFWYKIGDKIFFDNEKIIKNYEVVDKSPLVEMEERIKQLELSRSKKEELLKKLFDSETSLQEKERTIEKLVEDLEEKEKLIDEARKLPEPQPEEEKSSLTTIATILIITVLLATISAIYTIRKKN